MKSPVSSVGFHRQMTWKDTDPRAGFFSCLRTHREVECKTQSFLIYFYLGGFGSYSKLTCSIKDRTESVPEVQGETANQNSFPESAPDPRSGLSHLFRDMRSDADTGRTHKAHSSERSLPEVTALLGAPPASPRLKDFNS